MGALTPPVQAARHNRRRSWLLNVVALTVAGAGASVIAGSAFAYLGGSLGLPQTGTVGIGVISMLTALAVVRELGWTAIPLPQVRRQTAGIWAKRMGPTKAAILWGIDLGLFGTTWLTFAGAWLIPLLALLAGAPVFGAALFAAHWMGRALSVWLAPMLMPTGSDTLRLLDSLGESRRAAQLAHILVLAWSCVVLGVVAAGGGSL